MLSSEKHARGDEPNRLDRERIGGLVTPKFGLAAIWPEDAVTRFHSAWIETPFELVSIAQTPSGMRTIADLTGMTNEEISRLIDESRSLLSEQERKLLLSAVHPENMPLGALKPKL
jgi:hypothetical protein